MTLRDKSEPITIDCRECGGTGWMVDNPPEHKGKDWVGKPCSHCTESPTTGQRVIMKVKKCPDPICHKGIVILPMMNRNRGIRMKHIPCNGTGTIKEPLTLADIDFTGRLKLKGGWRVEVL